jgi:hypothetical protein
MAFESGTFVGLQTANSNAGKFWIYQEDEAIATIRGANYFNAALASYGLSDGDLILIKANDGFGISSVTVTGVNVTVAESITSA